MGHDILSLSKGVRSTATRCSTTIVKATTATAICSATTAPVASSPDTTCRIVIILIVHQGATIINQCVSVGIVDDRRRLGRGDRWCSDIDDDRCLRLTDFDDTCASRIRCLNVRDRRGLPDEGCHRFRSLTDDHARCWRTLCLRDIYSIWLLRRNIVLKKGRVKSVFHLLPKPTV